ncbi:hypothetical protein FRB90_012038 [Tulasnella sp. 427]|nr:hypothetical protein FRB90_012038 [Tulasnella sp. 427]
MHQQPSDYHSAHPPFPHSASTELQKTMDLPPSTYTSYTQSRTADRGPIVHSDSRWEIRPSLKQVGPVPEPSPLSSYPIRPEQYSHYRTTSSWSVQSSSGSYTDSYTRPSNTLPLPEVTTSSSSRYAQADDSTPSASAPSEHDHDSEADLHPSGRLRKGLWALVDAPNNNTGNPGYSIKVLMEYAIKGSPRGKLSLQEIYRAVEERYPVFKTSLGQNWRNSARHDISMDPRFKNVPRSPEEPGKGGLWMFDENAPPKPRKPRRKRTPQAVATSTPVSPESSSYPPIGPRPLRPRDTAPYPVRRQPEHIFSQQSIGLTLPGVENFFQQSG